MASPRHGSSSDHDLSPTGNAPVHSNIQPGLRRHDSLVSALEFINTTTPASSSTRGSDTSRPSQDGLVPDAGSTELRSSISSSHERNSQEQADTGSEWTSETTRNLLERIKQMRENVQYLPETPSSTNLAPLSPVTSSSSTTESPPPASSPPTSWSSRHLSPNMRRDSLTSLFSGTGSTSLKSKIPRLNLKKRFKKQVDSESHPASNSARLTRARHTPLVGLGISGVDPFSEPHCDEPEGLSREDSDATLMPPRSRPSYSSQYSEDAPETYPGCGDASSSSIVSPKTSVDDADFRHTPPLSRAYSADLLARSKRRTPAELLRAHSEDLLSLSRRNQAEASECGSPTRTASSTFTLMRFRSSNPFSTGNRSISDGAHPKPVLRAQRSRFNSAFSFSDDDSESSSLSYAQLAGRLRRVCGVSKLSKQFGWSKLDVVADVALPPDASSNDLPIKAENRQSYDEQLTNLRVKLSLPAQDVFHTGPAHLAHHNHEFVWDTRNLRCLVCPSAPSAMPTGIHTISEDHELKLPARSPPSATHLHPAIRPGFASKLDLINGTSDSCNFSKSSGDAKSTLTNLAFVHPALRSRLLPTTNTTSTVTISTASTPQSQPTLTALTCALCPTTCCIYSSLLSQPLLPSSPSLALFCDIIRLTAPGTPLGRSGGRNHFSTFVRCSNDGCGKMVCPGCASRCRLVGCGEVVCRGCREGGEGGFGWICEWHEEGRQDMSINRWNRECA